MQKLKDKQKIFLVVYKVKTTLLEEFQVLEGYKDFCLRAPFRHLLCLGFPAFF